MTTQDEPETTDEPDETPATVTINVNETPEEPEPEEPEEPEEETLSPRFSRESARSDADFRRLVMDNQRLSMDRLAQLSRLLETQAGQMRTVMAEMAETMTLAQEMIGRIDEAIERSGQQTAALVKVTRQSAEFLAAMEAKEQR